MIPVYLSGLIGFTTLLPGIAVVHIAGVGVQPITVALALYLAAKAATRVRFSTEMLVWLILGLLAGIVATLLSVSMEYSLKHLVLQSGHLLLAGAGFYLVLTTAREAAAFTNLFLVGAHVSSVAAAAQYAVSLVLGRVISLTNNANFALVAPADRGVAFTPEASILAMLLIPAVLITYNELKERDSIIWAGLRSRPALMVLLVGMLSTKSSAIILVPVIVLFSELLASSNFATFVRRNLRSVVFVLIAGAVFVPAYMTRLDRGDAQYSTIGRFEKFEAGLRIFASYPVSGAGLGMVSDPEFFDPFVIERTDWSWREMEKRRGVDSAVIRILAEAGLIGLLATYYPLVLFLSRMRVVFRTPEYRPFLVFCVSVLVFQTFVSGYRDLAFFYLPMVACAASPFLVRARLGRIGITRRFEPARAFGG